VSNKTITPPGGASPARAPGPSSPSPIWATLEAAAREHIQHMLQTLLDEELTAFLGRAKSVRRADGAGGYRNGHGRPRRVALMGGTVTVRRPRVCGLAARFESRLLPFFRRQTPNVTALLDQGYLHGLATGDFELALRHLLGDGAPLSRASLVRLTARWQAEYETWRARSLDDLEVVYWWADGLYVKAGLGAGRACLLVVIGALSDGTKVVLAVDSGERESAEAWQRVLRDLKARGLRAPKLIVADGHLGLWGAVGALYPTSAEQRCWTHRIRNVLDHVPQGLRAEVLGWLRQLFAAPTRAAGERLRGRFAARYSARYPKAVATLERDWARLVTFFDFPAEHWVHLRTSNAVESPFAMVRLRTSAAKRFRRVERATAMIWKVLCVGERAFKRLNAPRRCWEVYHDRRFRDGAPVPELTDESAAA
jgi:putative transposase